MVWGERGRAVQQAGGENDSPTAAGPLRPQWRWVRRGVPTPEPARRSEPRTPGRPAAAGKFSKGSDLFVLRQCFTILPDGVYMIFV